LLLRHALLLDHLAVANELALQRTFPLVHAQGEILGTQLTITTNATLATARAGNRRFGLLSDLRAHTKAP
jgi:hypothetical protein